MTLAHIEKTLSDTAYQTIYGLPEGADALWLAEQARMAVREDRIVTHIALDDGRVDALAKLLSFIEPEAEILTFPSWDCLPYDRVSPNRSVIGARVKTLCRLREIAQESKRRPRILLTTVNAASQKLTPPQFFDQAHFSAQIGGRVDIEALQAFLAANGYERVQTVRESGEFAIRGGIVDLYPSGWDMPIRMDLFGDEVESIKYFDPADQRSGETSQEFSLYPVSEYALDENSIENFRSQYRELFGLPKSDDPLYSAISEGRPYNGAEHWLPLFFDEMATLFDYTGETYLSIDAQGSEALDARLSQIEDFYQARQTLAQASKARKKKDSDVSLSGSVYQPIPWQMHYVDEDAWQDIVQKYELKLLTSFRKAEGQVGEDFSAKRGRDFVEVRAQNDGDVIGAVADHIKVQQKQGRQVCLATYSEGSGERLRKMLDTAKAPKVETITKLSELKKLAEIGAVGLAVLPLERGFETDNLCVISEQDMLGERLSRTQVGKKRKSDQFIREISSLSEGDYVVHVDHGVGKFAGLETLEAGGALHDCLKILYAGDDRLFVPVEHIEILSRFGGEDTSVQLDKLGGAGWQARKAKVKKDLMAMADNLLQIAAARQLQKADEIRISEGLYEEFASRFPYHETEDQLRAINAAIEDLGKSTPMDRLICGDVGFGKTEVALRAAYVAAMDGHQVAVVVPTTLLARQHAREFEKRFAGTGLRIGQLSRMVTAKEAEITKKEMREGTINIVIGTHALFTKGTKFANLGLVIVDEEQRFGVKQKEHLKSLKENVHVLTLTATPIPRTLQMSLTGVKEMSIIATPPVDRLAVRTFVLPHDPLVLREALMREHYRGGQSFYVCPRISDLEEIAESLREIVPELKFISAHGQLSAKELDERMTAFHDRHYDILLATNIIESGIDIPNANTMVVHRADMFGLSQLYQIRGRIGRSKQRAYAYLTHRPGKVLTDNAKKRLEVLETLDTLGAGFQLASHDMDIRGAGNLLGEQQSGHIREVGVELYQQMLEEAVAEARHLSKGGQAGKTPEKQSFVPTIQLGTSVMIPESYVPDLGLRMSLYRRIGELETEDEVESFAAEMIDRFGQLPEEVENLLAIITIKQLCRAADVEKVEAGPKGAVITFHKSFEAVEGLMKLIAAKPMLLKIRPDQKLVRKAEWKTPEERVSGVHTLMEQLAQL